MAVPSKNYPFAQEFVTDAEGQIRKVILDFADYQRLIEAVEDEGLYLAMQEIKGERPMSKEQALKELDV